MLNVIAKLLAVMFVCGNLVMTQDTVSKKQKLISYQESYIHYVSSDEEIMTVAGSNQIVNYVSRSTNTKTLAFRYPIYTYNPKAGACACVAGANVLGFYDRYDENLIPNHTSGTPIGSAFSYNLEDDSVREVIEQLYVYMGTKSTGTTEDEFIDGIKDFCKSKSKTVSFSSCMSLGSFSYSLAEMYIDKNMPIILFLSGYNVAQISEGTNRDTYDYLESTANHIMVGFGYKELTYQLSSGKKTVNLISVASGLLNRSSGLYDISYNTKINDALAINIG